MRPLLLFPAFVALSLAVDVLAVEPMGSLGAMRAAPYAERRSQEQNAVRDRIDEIGRSGVDRGLSLLNQGMNLFSDFQEFASSFEALNPDDLEFDPDYRPQGSPEIPVHCDVSGGDACRQCYDSAYRKLDFVRHYLEVMRGYYGGTKKYTERAIAFGDSMAGLHGGFGLAWPQERKGIEDAFEKMGKTYDGKYEDYMRELLEALQDLSACEKQYFGEDDWYNRYGFIYYTYMKDRYKRQ